MSNSTSHLDLLSSGQSQKEVTLNSIVNALSPAAMFARRDRVSAGLTWAYYGGTMQIGTTYTHVANGSVALAANATNYIEVTDAGVVTVNQTGFTAGKIPLYQVSTGATTVTQYTDYRTAATSMGGLSGVIATATGAVNAAITAHEAEDNPHPGYLTQTEADLLYAGIDDGIEDGDKGDIVVSGGGLVFTIDSNVLSAFGRSLIDDANAAAARVTLELGTASTLAFDTDTALSAASDTLIATQKAVKAYIDNLVTSGATDVMIFKNLIDCSTNPNYPAADAGHLYKVSVAGKIGGASGPNVEAGDTIYCIVDGSTSGTHATRGSNWSIAQANLDGAVIGPGVSVSGEFAQFDGTTGKLLKGGITLDTDNAFTANSDTRIPSQKAVNEALDAVATTAATTTPSKSIATPVWSANMALDFTNTDIYRITLEGDTAFTITGGSDGKNCQVELTQDVTGARLVTWPGNVRFSSDIPMPTLSTMSNNMDRIGFQKNDVVNKYDCVAVVRGY